MSTGEKYTDHRHREITQVEAGREHRVLAFRGPLTTDGAFRAKTWVRSSEPSSPTKVLATKAYTDLPRCSPAIDQRLKRPRTLPRGDTIWEPTIVLGEGYAETDAIYWLHHLTCGLARPSDRNMKVGQEKHNCVQTRCFESSRADSIYARFRAPQTGVKNHANARFHNHAADSAYHFCETGSGLKL